MGWRRAVQIAAGIMLVGLLALGGSELVDGRSVDDASAQRQESTPLAPAWSVSAAGAGDNCSAAAPCALSTALEKAGPGDVVDLGAGSYPALDLRATGQPADSADPVVLRAAPGAEPVLAALDVRAPGVVVQGLTIRGTVYVHPSAEGATLQDLHVDGSGVFLRASNSRLLDSVIENGSSIDGVQIKDGHDIVVQGNVIRYFDPLRGDLHADCIQLFDVQDVVIRGNTVHDCDNAGIIFSGGAGEGIDDVLVEANFVMGCRVVSERCRGGTAIDLREQRATDVVVRNNTFALGSVRMADTPGQVNDRNVFDYLSSCSTSMTNSVVRRWNTGLCATPAALRGGGNEQGTVPFADVDSVDLHVAEADRDAVTVTPVAVTFPAGTGDAVDVDGQAFAPTTAGADEPGEPEAAPSTTAAPSTAAPSSTSPPSTSTRPTSSRPVDPSSSAPPSSAPPSPSSSSRLQVQLALSRTPDSDIAVLTATVTGGTATGVRFAVGRGLTAAGTSTDGGRTWSARVDTSRVPDGTYSVVAVATTASGASVTSAPVTAVVDN